MNFFRQTEDYKREEEYAISYLKMRRLIGIFGFALPLILIAGTFLPGGLQELKPSISAYYDSYLRDVFVGVLCAVALFLFAYRGFNRIDTLAANSASFFALGIAFFPGSSRCAFIHYLHLICAALFFITLALISLFLFTKTRKGEVPKGRKSIRNKIYRICGYIMLGSLLFMLVYLAFLEKRFPSLEGGKPVLILETMALFAFGTSWLVKGRTLWIDK